MEDEGESKYLEQPLANVENVDVHKQSRKTCVVRGAWCV